MGEFLPLLLGCAVGVAFTGRSARTVRFAPLACVLTGALASALNGELGERFSSLFVSLDAGLVWLGAAVTATLLWSLQRRRATG
jgi:hypothetical protein